MRPIFSLSCVTRGLTAALGAMLSAAVLVVVPAAHAGQSRPSAETFFSLPTMSDAQLSPDGNFVAMLVRGQDGRMKLAVMDLADKSVKGIAGDDTSDIADVHWVNNERLVFSTSELNAAGQGDVRHWSGLIAINRDGSQMRTLVTRNVHASMVTVQSIQREALSGNTWFADVDRASNSNDIFVTQTAYSTFEEAKGVNPINLLRLDTKTGRTTMFDRPGDTVKWVIDQHGVPRINQTQRDGVSTVFYLDPATDKWRKIAEFEAYKPTFNPAFFAPDGTFYVLTRKGRDTLALYRFDFSKNAIEPKPVVAVDGYDFEGGEHSMVFNRDSKKLLGVHYQNDASGTLWLDERMQGIQKAVDALLPATINRLTVGRDAQVNNVLVEAYSDVQPSVYLIYDTSTGKLATLGNSRPDINPKQMAQQDMVHYKADDGLEIPAYLTLPRDGPRKNLPMVVLVHGGPYLRVNSWGWDSEVQFLASRGYAVLQPEFRGSMGFGYKLFRAGWKQWGLAMQDDIDNGARWAIAQGIADPKRICIAGASYGGYAALMGLAKDPDLFRCGFEWVGVTDLNLMLTWSAVSDMSEDWLGFGAPAMVGDLVKDAGQLQVTSPVNNADRIKQPVLLAYGGSDYRVPIAHGERMRAALRPYNNKVEWIEYKEEGHGWSMLKNRLDFWTHVEHFLDENIGRPPG